MVAVVISALLPPEAPGTRHRLFLSAVAVPGSGLPIRRQWRNYRPSGPLRAAYSPSIVQASPGWVGSPRQRRSTCFSVSDAASVAACSPAGVGKSVQTMIGRPPYISNNAQLNPDIVCRPIALGYATAECCKAPVSLHAAPPWPASPYPVCRSNGPILERIPAPDRKQKELLMGPYYRSPLNRR